MIATDEAALRCDFLETYHIFDYRALPARQAALFAYGLEENSRIRRKISGVPAGTETMLLAMIADALNILVWQNTQDGLEGRNRPQSILEVLRGSGSQDDAAGFDSAAEFEAWRAEMIGE